MGKEKEEVEKAKKEFVEKLNKLKNDVDDFYKSSMEKISFIRLSL